MRADHGRVLCCRFAVDEQVIIAGFVVQQTVEPAVCEEQAFSVREVTSYAHVRMSAGRHAQVLQSVEQRVELNHPVEQGRLGEVCSEA